MRATVGSGISILCLRDLIFRTEPEETCTPPSTQKSNSGLGDHDQESCHASTRSHTAGIDLVFRLGNPGTHAKLGHHIILVVQHRHLLATIGAKQWLLPGPLYQRTDILNRTQVRLGDIPEDGDESSHDECFTWQETTKKTNDLVHV